jgi:hypothetical protein
MQKRRGPIQITSQDNTTLISVPPGLEGITREEKVAAVESAIARLKTESGENGLVVILAFSHSAISSKIQGEVKSVPEQRMDHARELLIHGKVTASPASAGLTLEGVECFKPPENMALSKLNFSAIGAEGCITASSDPTKPDPNNYYLQLFRAVQSNVTKYPIWTHGISHIANAIFNELDQKIKPNISKDALAWVTDFAKPTRDEFYNQIKKEHQPKKRKGKTKSTPSRRSNSASPTSPHRRVRSRSPSPPKPSSHNLIGIFDSISKAAKERVINKNSYIRMNEAFRFENHHRNLETGRSFQKVHKTDCMINKQYLRNSPWIEHYPGLDWNLTLVSKNGTILVGNLLVSISNRSAAEEWSTLITTDMHAGFTADYSWMMDLITLIKIVKNTDTVTTESILNFLHENGIINVIFIDGGCNVFCDSHAVITCTSDHPQLGMKCYNCNRLIGPHPLGGGGGGGKKKEKRRIRTNRRNKRRKYKTHKRYK